MKQTCIFITGPESSGSTLAARIISNALGFESWNGRGFNCCNDGQCDAHNGYTTPCKPTDPLVCHRSLPFRHHWPPIEEWNKIYDGKYIICTRDNTISRRSQLNRFGWKSTELLYSEGKQAKDILRSLVKDEHIPTFIWSYETYILLGNTYLELLADFINIPRENFKETPPPRNENEKYLIPPHRKSLLGGFFQSKSKTG